MLLVKNGSVHLGSGEAPRKLDILMDGKLIVKVAENIEAPEAEVIDAAGKEVFPGYFLPLCNVGAKGYTERLKDSDEDTDPVTPYLNVRHAMDIREIRNQRYGRCGVTSYGLCPGRTNLIAGQMCIINVDGKNTADYILKDEAAVKANYIGDIKKFWEGKKMSPTTRMAMNFMVDDAFRQAKECMDKGENNPKHEAMIRVLKGEIPFVANAYSQPEIEELVYMGKKWGFTPVIVGAYELEKCADLLIENNVPVILGELTFYCLPTKYDTNVEKIVELYRRGLKLSLSANGDVAYPPAYDQYLWSAGKLIAAGATAEEVLDMMTVNPARALRCDDLVGSIKEGLHGDLLICCGDPITRFDAHVETSIVGGKVFYNREV